MNLALLIAIVSLIIWLTLLLSRAMYWRISTPIDDYTLVQNEGNFPSLTIIIPARNEADMLPLCLPSLLSQSYQGSYNILLIDDHSDDETVPTAREIVAQHDASHRVTLIKGRPRPLGWKGKVNAMQTGLDYIALQQDQAVQNPPTYILFTDADIAYENDMVSRIVAKAESGDFVLTSLMVKLRCKSLAERTLVPAFVYFFKLLYPFNWANTPSHPLAAAAGGSMLVRYDALMRAGGLAPIADALIDDCALGRLMKQQDKIFLALTEKVRSVRPYHRLSDIAAMVSRTAYDQLHYNPLLLLGTCIGLMITYIAPVTLLFTTSGAAQLLAVFAYVLMSLSFYPINRFYNRPAFAMLSLPAIAICYLGFTLNSAWQYYRGHGGMWKGRAQATRIHAQ